MSKINNYLYHPFPIEQGIKQNNIKKSETKKTSNFDQVLANELEQLPVKLSKHAKQRMDERNINLSNAQWNKIHSKLIEAKNKGITDSLIITQDAALVVSAPKNTVITAMNRKEAEAHIFTNINGTIILNDA
ncbi:flagellar operon protein [Terrilactibacillus sp. BCM23-1]|uniref:Flagellar operon protein n=1 Tax=Terrilactibacillus tamarindi TaxID=2599694 RepID=A0A6N8CQ66_9BACI|nr:TIGR02530 family flagellar biosynthesis protein [Terrilactibacillus tamarindi]MTT32274.1 flagellar operon protein [Terrilactibacillus tamarindi]